jgi:hypothetical protein
MNEKMPNRRRIAIGVAVVCLFGLSGGVVAATNGADGGTPSPAATVDTNATPTDDRPPYDWNAPPMGANGIAVPDVEAAASALPFTAAVPSISAAPTAVYVSDPAQVPPGQGAFAAIVKDSKYGVFQVLENTTGMTEDQLEAWATVCNTCSVQKVISVGATHFLILGSSHGLSISWLANGLLYTIQGPEDTFTETNATALAANLAAANG